MSGGNMKSTIIAIVAVLFFVSFGNGQTKYVGYEYEGVVPATTLPNGVKHMGGGLIGDFEADPVYGISQVEKGKTKMLWLEESTGKDSTGVTGWKVLDALSFPALTRTDYVFFAGDPAIGCLRDGQDIPHLVGVGRIIRRQGIFRPSRLWVANLATKKFEPMWIKDVKCEYSEP
jgi:hypothetical protein